MSRTKITYELERSYPDMPRVKKTEEEYLDEAGVKNVKSEYLNLPIVKRKCKPRRIKTSELIEDEGRPKTLREQIEINRNLVEAVYLMVARMQDMLAELVKYQQK